MRALLFLVAFAIALLATVPLDRVLLPLLRDPLAAAGVDLRVQGLRLALPAGVRASDVGLSSDKASLALDSVYIGITRSIDAEACGGHISGDLATQSVHLNLQSVDLSRCLRVGKLELETALDGELFVEGFDLSNPSAFLNADIVRALRANLKLTSTGGVFRGVVPGAGDGGSDLPLGEWEFNDLVLRAQFADGGIDIQEGHVMTSGVEWEAVSVQLPSEDTRGGLRLDFRARLANDTPRARALIGLMPKATEGQGGWRSYRVVGTLSAPRVVGLD